MTSSPLAINDSKVRETCKLYIDMTKLFMKKGVEKLIKSGKLTCATECYGTIIKMLEIMNEVISDKEVQELFLKTNPIIKELTLPYNLAYVDPFPKPDSIIYSPPRNKFSYIPKNFTSTPKIISFDDLNTDDESDIDHRHFASWAGNAEQRKNLARNQELLFSNDNEIAQLPRALFQVPKIDIEEIFPNLDEMTKIKLRKEQADYKLTPWKKPIYEDDKIHANIFISPLSQPSKSKPMQQISLSAQKSAKKPNYAIHKKYQSYTPKRKSPKILTLDDISMNEEIYYRENFGKWARDENELKELMRKQEREFRGNYEMVPQRLFDVPRIDLEEIFPNHFNEMEKEELKREHEDFEATNWNAKMPDYRKEWSE